MKKLILAFVVLVVVVVVGAAAAVATGVVKPPELEDVDNSWGAVTEEQTEVHTSIVLDNPNSIGVGLGNASLDVTIALNDVELGEGTVDGLDLPKGQSTTKLTTVIDNTQIPKWWASHVSNEERTAARITPKIRVSVFGRSVGVAVPAITREIETDILAGVSSGEPQTFPVGPFTMTVKSREFGWGDVTQESTEIEGIVVLHQDSPVAVPMTRLDFTFVMNGVTVGQATTMDPIVLLPDTDTPVPFAATLTNEGLLEWWPAHINADERTDYRILVDVVLEVSSGTLGSRSIPIRVVEFRDDFETDALGRKGG